MKKTFFDDLEKDIKILNSPTITEKGYTVDAITIRIPEELENFIKHDKRNRKIKDISYDGMPMEIKLKHQRFLNKSTNETISAPLDSILTEQSMTKRLNEYIMQLLEYKNVKNIADETGISKRKIYNLLENCTEDMLNNLVTNNVFIYRNDKMKKDLWIMIDVDTENIIGIIKDKQILIEKLIYNSYKHVIIPMDLELYRDLQIEEIKNIAIEQDSLKFTILKYIFKAYVTHRNKIKEIEIKRDAMLLTTSFEDEKRLFFKEISHLSKKETRELIRLLEENPIYSWYYDLKKLTTDSKNICYKTTASSYLSYETLSLNYINKIDSHIYSNSYSATNTDIIYLQGLLKTLQNTGIGITKNIFYKEQYSLFLEEYLKNENNLSDMQYLLRWNSINKDKKR